MRYSQTYVPWKLWYVFKVLAIRLHSIEPSLPPICIARGRCVLELIAEALDSHAGLLHHPLKFGVPPPLRWPIHQVVRTRLSRYVERQLSVDEVRYVFKVTGEKHVGAEIAVGHWVRIYEEGQQLL